MQKACQYNIHLNNSNINNKKKYKLQSNNT